MTQPIVHDYLTQIFCKHYKMQPDPAAEEAKRFIEIAELYGMQLIIGDWTVPEPISPWDAMMAGMKDTMDREPWLAKEIQ